MRILALDLGKQKTAAFVLDRGSDEQRHLTVKTTSTALHDLIVEVSPHRVVFEICPIAGWLSDLVRVMEIELQVVNVAHDAWRWRNVRTKSDRLDAVKLAELSLVDQLSRRVMSLTSCVLRKSLTDKSRFVPSVSACCRAVPAFTLNCDLRRGAFVLV